MMDITNTLLPVQVLAPANVKTTVASAWLDTQIHNAAAFFVQVQTLGDTLSAGTSYEFDVQESNDGSTLSGAATDQNVLYAVNGQYGTGGAANTGAGALLNSGASGSPAQVLKFGYLGNARFIRVNVVVSGTMTNGTSISILGVLGHSRHQPSGLFPQLP